MAKIAPLESHADTHEAWFERHPKLYAAEVEAVRELLTPHEKGRGDRGRQRLFCRNARREKIKGDG